MSKACWLVILTLFVMTAGLAQAQNNDDSRSASLDADLAALKADVAALNTELFELEEDILYPASTQLAVFLSLDVGDQFQLDSIELSVDGRMANSHLYSQQERQALQKGGIQQLYLGNVSPGNHQITATLNGKGANDEYFRKQETFFVIKESEPERVELTIEASPASQSPQFSIKRWQ